jgi:hypothetical protein
VSEARRRLETEQQIKAAAVEELAKNYSLKLDGGCFCIDSPHTHVHIQSYTRTVSMRG